MPCTASTPANARRAFGVCSSAITDEASWMTASAMAAISSGPPSAEATTQRTTNHDARGGTACAVVRAVPQTISSTGASGSTASWWPAMEIGTWCTASHMLAMAPSVPVMSLLAMTSCISVTAAMMTRATRKDRTRPEPGPVPGAGRRYAACPAFDSLGAPISRGARGSVRSGRVGARRRGRGRRLRLLTGLPGARLLARTDRGRWAEARETGRRGGRAALRARIGETARAGSRRVAAAVLRRVAGRCGGPCGPGWL